MKVILQRDIPKVGKGGDIVTVKDGYARNYLFPRMYAVAATGGALREHEARAKREAEREARNVEQARAGAEKMQELTLTIIGKVGAGTKLYGSITAADVAEAIQKECGVTVDRRRIGLADPIKNLGLYTIPVRLHTDYVVPVKVDVVSQEELERRRIQAEKEAAAARAAAEAAAEAEAAAAAAPQAEPAE